MRRIILSTLVLFTTLATNAQRQVGTTSIQPKVGLNIATITKDNDADPRLAPVIGAEFEHQVTDMVSLSAGLLYSMQGAKGNIGGVDGTVKLDYINIPILTNVYIAKGFAVKLGVQPGFMINDKVKVSRNGVTAEVGLENAFRQSGIDAKIKKLDVSIPVGASYEFSNFVVDARYNWGLTKIIDQSTSKNSVFQLTLGYKFGL
ncbi:porin family protein [Hallella colorans]|uniref:porin family protein n=1 Tax=Hallella colorans TaxID=1703337 RepID=UPI0023EFA5AB|nr:porin family protein [Hallella colorans]